MEIQRLGTNNKNCQVFIEKVNMEIEFLEERRKRNYDTILLLKRRSHLKNQIEGIAKDYKFLTTNEMQNFLSKSSNFLTTLNTIDKEIFK